MAARTIDVAIDLISRYWLKKIEEESIEEAILKKSPVSFSIWTDFSKLQPMRKIGLSLLVDINKVYKSILKTKRKWEIDLNEYKQFVQSGADRVIEKAKEDFSEKETTKTGKTVDPEEVEYSELNSDDLAETMIEEFSHNFIDRHKFIAKNSKLYMTKEFRQSVEKNGLGKALEDVLVKPVFLEGDYVVNSLMEIIKKMDNVLSKKNTVKWLFIDRDFLLSGEL